MQNRAQARHAQWLLAADVDGTLVDGDGNYFEGALELTGLRTSRLVVALCSARPLASLVRVSRELGGVSALGALGGSLLALPQLHGAGRSSSLEILGQIPPRTLETLHSVALQHGLELWLYGPNQWWVTQMTPLVEQESVLIQNWPTLGVPSRGTPILKCLLVTQPDGTDERVKAAALAISAVPGVSCLQSRPNYLEVNPCSSSETKGLEEIAVHFAVSRSRTIAVGDGPNDCQMLEYAAFGFLVGGAMRMQCPSSQIRSLPHSEDGGISSLVAWIKETLGR